MGLSAMSKMPCLGEPTDSDLIVSHQCYTEVGSFYASKGLAERFSPFYGESNRYTPVEYPVGTVLTFELAGQITHTLHGVSAAEFERRAQLDPETIADDAAVRTETLTFTWVMFVLLALVGGGGLALILSTMARRQAILSLALVAPIVVLTAFVNVDLLVLGTVAAALWAWIDRRPMLCGLFIGCGASAKLVPAFALGRRPRSCVQQNARTPRVHGRGADRCDRGSRVRGAQRSGVLDERSFLGLLLEVQPSAPRLLRLRLDGTTHGAW